MKLELFVTLFPSFPHFRRFAQDHRLSGIRLNSAMVHAFELDDELAKANSIADPVPLWFDIKGRQLRVKEAIVTPERLELILNHPIEVETPQWVLFKAGADRALLVEARGDHLIFDGGPKFMVKAGESLHIRHHSFKVGGDLFTGAEKDKIAKVKGAGLNRWFLSYVQSQRDVDEFRELIGDDQLILKIEDQKGVDYVLRRYRRSSNTNLMAARGDLFVEIEKPHMMMEVLRQIVHVDPEAYVGSRILLSVFQKEHYVEDGKLKHRIILNPVPECADLMDLAWLYDAGYRRMMLCDELCLREDLLGTAVNIFESFRGSYGK